MSEELNNLNVDSQLDSGRAGLNPVLLRSTRRRRTSQSLALQAVRTHFNYLGPQHPCSQGKRPNTKYNVEALRS